MIVDIREIYKEIQNRFNEIHAIQQMMQGKYRQYYQYFRRDPVRDKDILELSFIVKTTYSRFEENMKLIIEKTEGKGSGRGREKEPKGKDYPMVCLSGESDCSASKHAEDKGIGLCSHLRERRE